MCHWIITAARKAAVVAPVAILVGSFGYHAENTVADKYKQQKKSNSESSKENILERRMRMNFLRCAK